MVVVASMGGRATGGYSIEIVRVAETTDRLYVEVREVSPGRSCIVTMAGTAPVTAVRVPRRDLPVEFVERAETRDCG